MIATIILIIKHILLNLRIIIFHFLLLHQGIYLLAEMFIL
uniref:Uncharacterized protein n=1 Tax=Siphoviridae sp. ctLqe90 TaxID=2825456 RepID=A0A8S5Q3E2_9CAUD|nr:MAG TPA: hypothetical protein [Siphoviridae sp. ctLqe90]DAG36059.1 MAG TPA: hypothetical protein [Caudoviricetes sp.]